MGSHNVVFKILIDLFIKDRLIHKALGIFCTYSIKTSPIIGTLAIGV